MICPRAGKHVASAVRTGRTGLRLAHSRPVPMGPRPCQGPRCGARPIAGRRVVACRPDEGGGLTQVDRQGDHGRRAGRTHAAACLTLGPSWNARAGDLTLGPRGTRGTGGLTLGPRETRGPVILRSAPWNARAGDLTLGPRGTRGPVVLRLAPVERAGPVVLRLAPVERAGPVVLRRWRGAEPSASRHPVRAIRRHGPDGSASRGGETRPPSLLTRRHCHVRGSQVMNRPGLST
jgi:hypothetical protein